MGYKRVPPWVYKEEAAIREVSLDASHQRRVNVLMEEIRELRKENTNLKEKIKELKNRTRELEEELERQKRVKAVRTYRRSKPRRKMKLPKEVDIV